MNSALLDAPPAVDVDVLVGRLQPGDQLMLPELPTVSPVTFLRRSEAPDGRWYVTFTVAGQGEGSVLRSIDARVTLA